MKCANTQDQIATIVRIDERTDTVTVEIDGVVRDMVWTDFVHQFHRLVTVDETQDKK